MIFDVAVIEPKCDELVPLVQRCSILRLIVLLFYSVAA